VTSPKELGGLRWLWMRKTQPKKAWSSLPFKATVDLKAFFSMVVITELGDGNNTLFWQDRWIGGKSINDLAPLITALIPTRVAGKRTIYEALNNMMWVTDIHVTVLLQLILQLLELCQLLDGVSLRGIFSLFLPFFK
jgi:hypothetical protein